MKRLSNIAKTYIISIILIGFALIGWAVTELDWSQSGLYLLAALGAVAQTLKVEGPNDRTNYSIAWFVYGFTLIAFGLSAAILVIVVAHLAEWLWHKYPWFIQGFNIGNHVAAVFLAGSVFTMIGSRAKVLDLRWTLGLIVTNLIFVVGNHFMVGLVVKVARGQSFAESGVFELLTLSLDFAILTLGTVTALAWSYNPFLSVLNIPLLYPLHHALRLPALKRQSQTKKA